MNGRRESARCRWQAVGKDSRAAVAGALSDHSPTTGYRRAEQSGMDGCCDPRGCDSMFGAGYAREQARRYRRRGLGVAERDIVDFVSRRGLGGATILEIGGGIGEIPAGVSAAWGSASDEPRAGGRLRPAGPRAG